MVGEVKCQVYLVWYNLLDFKCGVEYARQSKDTGELGGWYFERERASLHDGKRK